MNNNRYDPPRYGSFGNDESDEVNAIIELTEKRLTIALGSKSLANEWMLAKRPELNNENFWDSVCASGLMQPGVFESNLKVIEILISNIEKEIHEI